MIILQGCSAIASLFLTGGLAGYLHRGKKDCWASGAQRAGVEGERPRALHRDREEMGREASQRWRANLCLASPSADSSAGSTKLTCELVLIQLRQSTCHINRLICLASLDGAAPFWSKEDLWRCALRCGCRPCLDLQFTLALCGRYVLFSFAKSTGGRAMHL